MTLNKAPESAGAEKTRRAAPFVGRGCNPNWNVSMQLLPLILQALIVLSLFVATA